MSSQLSSSGSADRYFDLLKMEPYLIELLLLGGSAELKNVAFSELVAKVQTLAPAREAGSVPASILFTDAAAGPITRWLVDGASEEEAALMKSVLTDVYTASARCALPLQGACRPASTSLCA
jgi:hypothetical protein